MIYEKEFTNAANEQSRKTGKDLESIMDVAKGLHYAGVSSLKVFAWCKTGLYGASLGRLSDLQKSEYNKAINEFKQFLKERN